MNTAFTINRENWLLLTSYENDLCWPEGCESCLCTPRRVWTVDAMREPGSIVTEHADITRMLEVNREYIIEVSIDGASDSRE